MDLFAQYIFRTSPQVLVPATFLSTIYFIVLWNPPTGKEVSAGESVLLFPGVIEVLEEVSDVRVRLHPCLALMSLLQYCRASTHRHSMPINPTAASMPLVDACFSNNRLAAGTLTVAVAEVHVVTVPIIWQTTLVSAPLIRKVNVRMDVPPGATVSLIARFFAVHDTLGDRASQRWTRLNCRRQFPSEL